MTRYQFMHEHRDAYPLTMLAKILEVSSSGYYAWIQRPPSERLRRREQLAEAVRSAYDDSHGIYGSRKVARELVERSVQACRNTVAGLMRQMSLESRAQRRRRYVVTTDSDHPDPIAPNRLDRDFTATAPNEKWVADITFVPTDEGWAYLAAVMDLFSRRIVGWAVSDSLETSLVLDAIGHAIAARRPGPGLVHHSDRGSQYASGRHRALLANHGIECSMSRRGDCWDNAPMERFMGSFKNEWAKHHHYETVEAVRRSVFKYIEIFYNRERRHQALGYVSPVQFEANHRGTNAA